jgi:hypothetical protein
LRAAVHSSINSNKKKGMANSTGSRICEGSADQNPVTAFIPIDYDDRRGRRDGEPADPMDEVLRV